MKRLIPLLLLAGCPTKEETNGPIEREPQPITSTSSTAISYRLSFAERTANYVTVDAVFPTAGEKELLIAMPVWTPGSYLVREFARNVHDFEARSERGKLSFAKAAKNRWRIALDGSKEIAIRYRLYAHHPNVRENYVDRDMAVLNGAATFFTDTAHPDRTFSVKLDLPKDWKSAISSMTVTSSATFTAGSFDELVDSPIFAGNPTVHRFEVVGTEHLLVNAGEGTTWDGPRSANDAEILTKTVIDFWGVIPYPRYVFFNIINDGNGGLEHKNSTLIMSPRWRTRDEDDYRGWLSVMTHELFHAWNGKRLRPAVHGPFDYEREVYSTDLWIVEGLTTYYDDILVTRSGLMNEQQYLSRLSQQIEEVQRAPGRKHDSLAAASYDAWIEFYRWDENTNNVSINYYSKGGVVGFLIDAAIRRETNDTKTLDDVMRTAYSRWSGERGYTTADFHRIVEELAGRSVRDRLIEMTETTNDLDFEPAFDWYGLDFEPPSSGDPKAFIGAKTEKRDGRIIVTEVLENGPSYGKLNSGDEIIAIDGYRVDDLTARLERYRPQVRVKLLIARRGLLTELAIGLGEKPVETWKVRPEKVRSTTQIKRFNRLLGK